MIHRLRAIFAASMQWRSMAVQNLRKATAPQLALILGSKVLQVAEVTTANALPIVSGALNAKKSNEKLYVLLATK